MKKILLLLFVMAVITQAQGPKVRCDCQSCNDARPGIIWDTDYNNRIDSLEIEVKNLRRIIALHYTPVNPLTWEDKYHLLLGQISLLEMELYSMPKKIPRDTIIKNLRALKIEIE